MKKFLCLLLGLCMMFSLFACGGTEGPEGTSGSDTAQGTDATQGTDGTNAGTSSDSNDPAQVSNLVLATDQKQERLVVYDMDILDPGDSLDYAQIWSYDIGEPYIAGLKYREDTVFGDVILAVGDDAYMISYPEKELLWQCTEPGRNPHCIEILPNGDIVIALSDGGDAVRLYNTSVLAKGGSQESALVYAAVPLGGAHGVLYDPEEDVIWALGGAGLIALQYGNDGRPFLTQQSVYSFSGFGSSGHSLSVDLSIPNYLYMTCGECVLRFNKKDKRVEKVAGVLNVRNVKGLGVNRNGNAVLCFPDEISTYSWRTHTIQYYDKVGGAKKFIPYTSAKSEFYKVVIFDGKYL